MGEEGRNEVSKKWVRMEESGRVDDEGRPILESGFDGGVLRSSG